MKEDDSNANLVASGRAIKNSRRRGKKHAGSHNAREQEEDSDGSMIDRRSSTG